MGGGPVVSRFPAPVTLASSRTLLSPLATLSLNPKHVLTPEVHVSIVLLSKEASVFFLQGINSELETIGLVLALFL